MTSDSLRLLEIYDRSKVGPSCKMMDFDARILPKKITELVREYGIRYDPENPVPSDDSLADDLFQAGLRLFLDVGVLCNYSTPAEVYFGGVPHVMVWHIVRSVRKNFIEQA